MSYLALGSDRLKMAEGLEDEPIIWDVTAGAVEVPIKDNSSVPKITMMSIGDIGRFVAAACELLDGSRKESMEMVGGTMALDEVTEIIGEVTWRSMEVSKVGKGELKRRADEIEGIGASREEIVRKMVSEIEVCLLERGEEMSVYVPAVHGLCLRVKPMSVQEMFERAWG